LLNVDRTGCYHSEGAINAVHARRRIIGVRERSLDSHRFNALKLAHRFGGVLDLDCAGLLYCRNLPWGRVDAVVRDFIGTNGRPVHGASSGHGKDAPNSVVANGTGIRVKISGRSLNDQYRGVARVGGHGNHRDRSGRGGRGSGGGSGGWSRGRSGTNESVANTFLSRRTFDTTVGNINLDVHRTSLDTSAAGLVASRPKSVFGYTVNWAWVHVAVGETSQGCCAGLATMGGGSDDGTGFGFDAATAKLRASTVLSPVGDNTINRAGKSVASSSLIGVTAGNSTVASFRDYLASTSLSASGAGNGAFGPCRPLGHDAINGASESVATNRGGQSNTGAAVHGGRSNGTRLGLGTSTA